MTSLQDKKDWILQHEAKFADALAEVVLKKPKASAWMILIPIILVYHVYRYQSVASGRKIFAEKYLITRQRTLAEALASVESGKAADLDKLAEISELPPETHAEYSSWLNILCKHYQDLLQAEGDCFESLVKSAYGSRTTYLLLLNQLNTAEKRFNSALKPHLYQTTEDVDEIMAEMERHSERLRRHQAELVFP